ncbi:MAG TPA: condensation domain-containing protein, partial [Aquabacterium sp.]|nr:condensation domain-containing protein [Aquabacterium sp.]
MSFDTLLDELEDKKIKVLLDKGELVVRAPKGAMTAELASRLKANRDALTQHLSQRDTAAAGAAPTAPASPEAQPVQPASASRKGFRITPEMISLARLTQQEIDHIVAQVPGGAANVQDIYPLAPLQEGILFHHMMSQQGDPYLLPILLAFARRERLERFLSALRQCIQRHDVLRTGMVWQGLGEPMQVVWRRAELPVTELVLDPADGDIATQLEQRFDPQHTRLDLSRAPMLACHLAEDAAQGRWQLHIQAHHLAVDHTTMELLIEEAQLIEAGRAHELPVPVPFRNFVAQGRLGMDKAEHEAFFREMLADIDAPTAPFGLLDTRGDGADVHESTSLLPQARSLALRQQVRALGVSPAAFMHLAWALVLARTTARQDVVFGTVFFGRMHGGPQASRVMGMFINTLPIRLSLGDISVEAALRAAHDRLASLLRHEHAPLSLAQRCSAVRAPAPLFSSLLNYRHSAAGGDAPPAGAAEDADDDMAVISSQERTNYPFVLSVDDLGEGFALTAQVSGPVEPQ